MPLVFMDFYWTQLGCNYSKTDVGSKVIAAEQWIFDVIYWDAVDYFTLCFQSVMLQV